MLSKTLKFNRQLSTAKATTIQLTPSSLLVVFTCSRRSYQSLYHPSQKNHYKVLVVPFVKSSTTWRPFLVRSIIICFMVITWNIYIYILTSFFLSLTLEGWVSIEISDDFGNWLLIWLKTVKRAAWFSPHVMERERQSWTMDSTSWIPDSTFRQWNTAILSLAGFRIPAAVFRIPKPRVADSASKNFPDSGIRIPSHGLGEGGTIDYCCFRLILC